MAIRRHMALLAVATLLAALAKAAPGASVRYKLCIWVVLASSKEGYLRSGTHAGSTASRLAQPPLLPPLKSGMWTDISCLLYR